MDVIPDDDIESVEAVESVHLSQMATGEQLSVQHFQIEPDAAVPEHSHPHEQAGYITQGTITFHIDGVERIITEGDSYVIPGGESHAAVNESDIAVEGVDVFSPPRTNPDWQE